ncbi:MAG: hypothetical protein HZA28_07980 [Candidatus Omnitrophica bacterium]|nr:hypothetical protein [Candidatus Omnitrophota bacterium]
MKTIIDDARREFIAKIVADLGKTIFAVGLASYFFEKFPVPVKIALGLLGPLLIVISVFIHPRKGDE